MKPNSPATITHSIHLNGLNGIRAIACLIVLILHIDQFIKLFGLSPLGLYKNGMHLYAVDIFFVLSGFLITYLLLNEKKQFGNVQIKKFYMRRILRIWPLYYLIVLFAIILLLTGIIPLNKNSIISISFATVFLSNIAYALKHSVTGINQLWSLGVEEQFYAIWPFIINKSKKIITFLLIFISSFILLKIISSYLHIRFLSFFMASSLFDCLAIGGVFGWVLFNEKYKNIFFNPFLQVLSWLILIISIVYKPFNLHYFINYEIHSFFYGIIIINVAANPKTIITLRSPFMEYIGKISYGIYMFHLLILFVLSLVFKTSLNALHKPIAYSIVYTLVIFLTIIISSLSYKYFESFFLSKKREYSRIQT